MNEENQVVVVEEKKGFPKKLIIGGAAVLGLLGLGVAYVIKKCRNNSDDCYEQENSEE